MTHSIEPKHSEETNPHQDFILFLDSRREDKTRKFREEDYDVDTKTLTLRGGDVFRVPPTLTVPDDLNIVGDCSDEEIPPTLLFDRAMIDIFPLRPEHYDGPRKKTPLFENRDFLRRFRNIRIITKSDDKRVKCFSYLNPSVNTSALIEKGLTTRVISSDWWTERTLCPSHLANLRDWFLDKRIDHSDATEILIDRERLALTFVGGKYLFKEPIPLNLIDLRLEASVPNDGGHLTTFCFDLSHFDPNRSHGLFMVNRPFAHAVGFICLAVAPKDTQKRTWLYDGDETSKSFTEHGKFHGNQVQLRLPKEVPWMFEKSSKENPMTNHMSLEKPELSDWTSKLMSGSKQFINLLEQSRRNVGRKIVEEDYDKETHTLTVRGGDVFVLPSSVILPESMQLVGEYKIGEVPPTFIFYRTTLETFPFRSPRLSGDNPNQFVHWEIEKRIKNIRIIVDSENQLVKNSSCGCGHAEGIKLREIGVYYHAVWHEWVRDRLTNAPLETYRDWFWSKRIETRSNGAEIHIVKERMALVFFGGEYWFDAPIQLNLMDLQLEAGIPRGGDPLTMFHFDYTRLEPGESSILFSVNRPYAHARGFCLSIIGNEYSRKKVRVAGGPEATSYHMNYGRFADIRCEFRLPKEVLDLPFVPTPEVTPLNIEPHPASPTDENLPTVLDGDQEAPAAAPEQPPGDSPKLVPHPFEVKPLSYLQMIYGTPLYTIATTPESREKITEMFRSVMPKIPQELPMVPSKQEEFSKFVKDSFPEEFLKSCHVRIEPEKFEVHLGHNVVLNLKDGFAMPSYARIIAGAPESLKDRKPILCVAKNQTQEWFSQVENVTILRPVPGAETSSVMFAKDLGNGSSLIHIDDMLAPTQRDWEYLEALVSLFDSYGQVYRDPEKPRKPKPRLDKWTRTITLNHDAVYAFQFSFPYLMSIFGLRIDGNASTFQLFPDDFADKRFPLIRLDNAAQVIFDLNVEAVSDLPYPMDTVSVFIRDLEVMNPVVTCCKFDWIKRKSAPDHADVDPGDMNELGGLLEYSLRQPIIVHVEGPTNIRQLRRLHNTIMLAFKERQDRIMTEGEVPTFEELPDVMAMQEYKQRLAHTTPDLKLVASLSIQAFDYLRQYNPALLLMLDAMHPNGLCPLHDAQENTSLFSKLCSSQMSTEDLLSAISERGIVGKHRSHIYFNTVTVGPVAEPQPEWYEVMTQAKEIPEMESHMKTLAEIAKNLIAAHNSVYHETGGYPAGFFLHEERHYPEWGLITEDNPLPEPERYTFTVGWDLKPGLPLREFPHNPSIRRIASCQPPPTVKDPVEKKEEESEARSFTQAVAVAQEKFLEAAFQLKMGKSQSATAKSKKPTSFLFTMISVVSIAWAIWFIVITVLSVLDTPSQSHYSSQRLLPPASSKTEDVSNTKKPSGLVCKEPSK